VRDPVEISQTGLPASVDAIVPVRIHSSEFDQSIREYVLKDNPHFIEQMQAANLPWNDDITEDGFAWMMYFE